MRLRGRRCIARSGSPENSARFLDFGWLPGAVQNRLLAPIGANVEREVAVRSGEPVALLVLARRFGAGVKRERAVGISLLRDNDVAEPTKSPVPMWAWPFIA